MTEFKESTYVVILISRFLSGNATDEEVEELKLWRKKCAENEKLYQNLLDKHFWEDKWTQAQKTDIIGAYMNVVKKRENHIRNRMICRFSAVVASLIFPLAVGMWLFFQPEPSAISYSGREGMKLVKDSIYPGEVKAELILADGSAIRLDGTIQDSLTKQAGSLIKAAENGLSYANEEPVEELVYNFLNVPRGGEYSLTLGDGTVVFLNSESTLRYPVQFVGNERKVELTGEAYFEVAASPEKPFIVECNHSQVKVLGTSFNLRSYKDEGLVSTTLVEGKVLFITEKKKEINLVPGEQAIMNEEGELVKKEVDVRLYTAWKDGNFVFYKQSLEEVMRVIARWYDVEVHFIDASQRKVVFTGNVKRYDDFSRIVKMLEMTGNTEFLINGKNIFIREK